MYYIVSKSRGSCVPSKKIYQVPYLNVAVVLVDELCEQGSFNPHYGDDEIITVDEWGVEVDRRVHLRGSVVSGWMNVPARPRVNLHLFNMVQAWNKD